MIRRRLSPRCVLLSLAAALLLTACASAQPARPWSTSLAWGRDVVLGREPGGTAVGPLAIAAGTDVMVLADSFGHRLLLWRRNRGTWQGPVKRGIPTRAAIVAVAVAPTGSDALAVAADAAGGVWTVPVAGPVRLLAELRAPRGDFRSVTALAVAPNGMAVVDAVDIGAEHSERLLIAVTPSGSVRVLGAASIAHGSPQERANGLPPLLGARGVRDGLASCSAGGVWAAVRGPGLSSGSLVCLDGSGRVLRRRPLPALRPPADFLGVDRQGRAVAVEGAGTASASVVVFGVHGRARSLLPAPRGAGPLLPHPAALAPDGALLLLTADPGGVRLTRLPQGWRVPIGVAPAA